MNDEIFNLNYLPVRTDLLHPLMYTDWLQSQSTHGAHLEVFQLINRIKE